MEKIFKQLARDTIPTTGKVHFERLAPVDTRVPTSYAQHWNISKTPADNVHAYLVAIDGGKYALHVYGCGEMQSWKEEWDESYQTGFPNVPWKSYLYPNNARNNSLISQVFIHEGVKNIGACFMSGRGFAESYQGKALAALSIASTVRLIDFAAFRYNAPATLTIPEGVRRIRFAAFQNAPENTAVATNITVKSLPSSVVWCVGSAFYKLPFYENAAGNLIVGDGCLIKYGGNLNSRVTIPQGVKCISAFPDSFKTVLTSINLPEGLKYIEQATFYQCSRLNNVILPSTTEVLDYNAFLDCTSLANVTLNDGLQRIKAKAFGGCTALRSIFIPASVTELSAISAQGDLTAATSPFYGSSSNLRIYCEATQKPEGWSEFWNYVGNSATATVYWGISRIQYGMLGY